MKARPPYLAHGEAFSLFHVSGYSPNRLAGLSAAALQFEGIWTRQLGMCQFRTGRKNRWFPIISESLSFAFCAIQLSSKISSLSYA